MRSIVRILVCLLLALIVLHTEPAQAATINNCGKLPSVAVEKLRNIKAGTATATSRVYNNAGGYGGTRLPSIGRGQEYREYDVDANNPNAGNRGKYRFVTLITKNKGKNVYEPIYFTLDHYKTFCKL